MDELLDRHQYGDRTYTFYTNQNARKREERSIGQLLGMTFGEETIAAVQEKARQDHQSFVESFRGIKIDTVNFYSAPQSQPDISAALEYMIRHQCQTNERLMDCLIEALSNSPDHNTRELAGNAKKDTKGFLEKLAGHAKNAATVATSGQTLYKAGAAIVEAIQGAWPKLMEILPELAESAQHLPPLF